MQRKGQFLWNTLWDEMKDTESSDSMHDRISNRIWNMDDTEFDKIMKLRETKDRNCLT